MRTLLPEATFQPQPPPWDRHSCLSSVPDIRDLGYEEVTTLLASWGEPPYRARQVCQWIFQKGATEWQACSNLTRTLRQRLEATHRISRPTVLERLLSRDGSVKYLLGLDAGENVESVVVAQEDRPSLCLSTQVGCRLACRFCRTGVAGFRRHLRPGEIVGQYLALCRDPSVGDQVPNLVLMGMGEPLDNYESVVRALRILTSPHCVGLAPKRITLSTVGLVPQLRSFAREGLGINLAISLHAARDPLRSELVPINRKYGLSELMAALREYPLPPRRRLTIEYVLLEGVNDSDQDARDLARLLRAIRCKVNLIPFNDFPGAPYRRPPVERIEAFQKVLENTGYTATVRWSRGPDVAAACGQLTFRTVA